MLLYPDVVLGNFVSISEHESKSVKQELGVSGGQNEIMYFHNHMLLTTLHLMPLDWDVVHLHTSLLYSNDG